MLSVGDGALLPPGTPAVTVTIVVGQRADVMLVPVAALVATSTTGYAIEIRHAASGRSLVPVTVLGYDETSGEAAISGRGVTSGEMVAIPSLAG